MSISAHENPLPTVSASAALLSDAAIFRALADNAADSIMITALDGTVAYANRASYTMLGYDYDQQELIGLTAATIIPAESRETTSEEVTASLAAAGIWRGELRQQRKDGTLIDVSAAAFILQNSQGELAGVASIVRDITELKASRQALIESEDRFRRVIESSPDIIVELDRQGRVEMLYYPGVGLMPDKVGQQYIDLILDEEAKPVVQAAIDAALSSGQPAAFSSERLNPLLGEKRWYNSIYTPFRAADGQIAGVIIATRDITDIKRSELERDALQQQVIEAQRQALAELSTPIIPVVEGIIVMPLVGAVDTQRSRDVMRALLEGISRYRAQIAIVDITGVPVVDTGVAQHLDKTIQAARLKGVQTLVTGVSESVAETIVDLGINWQGIETLRDLQTGLRVALKQLGKRIGV